MTLLWFDGFEGADHTAHYTNIVSTWATNATTRFSYGVGLGCSVIGQFSKVFTASTDIYLGVAIRISPGSVLTTPGIDFYGDSNATQHIRFMYNASGGIDIKRGTTTVIATSATGLVLVGNWYYFEIRVKISDTVGVVEVRMSGNPTPIVSFSGDTKNGGTLDTVDAVRFHNLVSGDSAIYDDMWICNGLGSSNNGFLGDRRVYHSVPTGAGASTGMTPSTGSNWQTVDEAPPVSTDYSGSAVSGTRDSYTITDLPSSPASIHGVRVVMHAHKSDAGLAQMKPVLRVGSTNYYGTTRVLGTTMLGASDLWETSPATATAWTASEINGAEIGGEVV